MNQLPQIKVKGTLADRTYDALKRAIIDLELMPGEAITEETLSEQLGVSRTPIRSALNRLYYEGLVTISQGKGSYVAELTAQELKDLFHVRRALEQLSIHLAMEALTDQDLQGFRELLVKEEQTFSGEEKDFRRFMLSDIHFHLAIANVSKNLYLERQLDSVLNNCSRYTTAFLEKVMFLSSHEYHMKIVELMGQGDEPGAIAALMDHINEIEEGVTCELEARAAQKRKGFPGKISVI